MPVENMEEQGLAKNPNLELAQWGFLLTTDAYKSDKEMKNKFLAEIKLKSMTPYYEDVCKSFGWDIDEVLLNEMKKANKEELEKLDKEYADAQKNDGETEIRDAMLHKAEYLCQIGAKEEALVQFQKTQEKAGTIGCKLDIIFNLIRMGLFYLDHDLTTRNIEKAKSLIEEGGDWDRRNRLKVYESLHLLNIRDFSKAAQLLLETVATFTSYELMDFTEFVAYTVYSSIISLDRPTLKDKVIRGAEIQEVLFGIPQVKRYLESMYDCHYADFFRELAVVEQTMKHNRYLAPHYRHYTREMRVLAYKQLLQSYSFLTLSYMASTFGISVDFIDRELARFIAQGRIDCKIDRVNGIVETTRPDNKNWQYQSAIKQGDMLLNRIQKLSRVIDI